MNIPQDRAAYRILAPHGFFGPDDHLYQEGDCIVFDGVPNEEMEPLNGVAEKRLQEFITLLDQAAKEAAIKLGRPYMGRPKDADGIFDLARKSEIDRVAIMGSKKETTGVERLDVEDVPEVGTANPKKGRMKGTLKIADAA